ncbi:MAG: OmcA/MtrC family decaheme c-type cytochrome [Bryobacteraceae bacterium]
MRIPQSVFAIGRYTLILAVLAPSIMLLNGDVKKNVFGVHDAARYADPNVIEYIQPGLKFTVVSAKIASDGTISVDYKIADPTGAALDSAGIVTPGPVSASFLAAYIPAGQAQFASYIIRTVSAVTGSATGTQASGDSGGTTQTVATGEYIYTFKTKAPAGFNASLTNRIGIYGSRNLTQWGLGTDYADTTFDFVPAGGTPAPRDVVRNADCNACHGSAATSTGSNGLAAHGGSRKSVGLCIICHQPQTVDPNTGNSLDMKVFIHKIHLGSSLPSVQAGKPYQVFGHNNAVSDWSTVVYPADARRCQTCHNPKNGAAQTSAWLTTPGAAACGSCHDNANFATGVNHAGGPQPDDSECANCHIQQGELPFDASILGAHTIPAYAPGVPGINFTLVSVANGTAGQKPTVTFTVKDNSGNPIPMSTFAANSGSLSLTMAGPTSDYGYTNFGVSTTPGYVTESVTTAAQCGTSGTCTYAFTHPVPAGATGTYAIGIEGRMSITLLAGTTSQTTAQYSGHNQVIYFSVDGTPVQPRRTVVAMANCNACHADLELHGSLRNDTAYCVLCHNPSNTDFTTRPTSTVASYQTLPPQGINFAMMVHKIHTGLNLEANFNQDYIIVGHGGATSDFGAAFASVPAAIPNSGVRFPVMGPTGQVQDTTQCYMCHTGGSEGVFPEGKNAVTDPEGLLNPAPATTSACTACHLNTSAFAHAVSQTDPKFGETCDVCHATGQAFDVDVVHAGK